MATPWPVVSELTGEALEATVLHRRRPGREREREREGRGMLTTTKSGGRDSLNQREVHGEGGGSGCGRRGTTLTHGPNSLGREGRERKEQQVGLRPKKRKGRRVGGLRGKMGLVGQKPRRRRFSLLFLFNPFSYAFSN